MLKLLICYENYEKDYENVRYVEQNCFDAAHVSINDRCLEQDFNIRYFNLTCGNLFIHIHKHSIEILGTSLKIDIIILIPVKRFCSP